MRIKLNPSLTCNHVNITKVDGTILATLTRDGMVEVDDDHHPLINRIRHMIKRYKAQNPSATIVQIKTFIEAEDF